MRLFNFMTTGIQNVSNLMCAAQREYIETQKMLVTFTQLFRYRLSKNESITPPNELEIEQARQQLQDLPKFLPFLGLAIMPLPGITEVYILAAILLERQLNGKVSLLPNQFREVFSKQKHS